MIRSLLFILFSIGLSVFAVKVEHTLSIVSDSISMFDSVKFARTHFLLDESSAVISLNVEDTLILTLINEDSVGHAFKVDGKDNVYSLNIEDTSIISLTFDQAGLYFYKDPLEAEKGIRVYQGLMGCIVVKDHAHSSYYWNLKEYQINLSDSVNLSDSIDRSNYDPEYFTINGKSYPETNEDTDTRVTGQVGDSIYLYISNFGNSIHSLHFHGYHAEIISSSKFSFHKGRSKDTFPVYPLESLILLLIPDQAGEYPVHDHNLVAVSGNGSYANGMFTTILIQP